MIEKTEFQVLNKKLIHKITSILFQHRSVLEYGLAPDSLEELQGEDFLPRHERSLGGIRMYVKNKPDYFLTIRHRKGALFDVYISEKNRNKVKDLVSKRCRYIELPKVVKEGLEHVLNGKRYY